MVSLNIDGKIKKASFSKFLLNLNEKNLFGNPLLYLFFLFIPAIVKFG